mmetsp:Transcript_44022/g.117491  ORF Transcript_44022/g.117491 Transcript_44022/m.117491 type:complete len:92 (-) Transcript_44022:60-335(-)
MERVQIHLLRRMVLGCWDLMEVIMFAIVQNRILMAIASRRKGLVRYAMGLIIPSSGVLGNNSMVVACQPFLVDNCKALPNFSHSTTSTTFV